MNGVQIGHGFTTAGGQRTNAGRPASKRELTVRRGAHSLSLLGVLVACGCFAQPLSGPSSSVAMLDVSVTTEDLNALGATTQVVVKATDKSGNTVQAAFVFGSSDPNVASVSASGLVTAVSNGTAKITVSEGSVFAEVPVTVRQIPANITITPEILPTFSAFGETAQLSAVVVDSNGFAIADRTITWTSLDPSAVAVAVWVQGGTGVTVTALANGTTTISATSEAVSRTLSATVVQMASSVTVTPVVVALTSIDQNAQLTAVVRDSRNNILPEPGITWQSSNPAVAVVSPTGSVTALGNGSTTVAALSGSAIGTATVAVNQTVQHLNLDVTPTTLQIGQLASYTISAVDNLNNPVVGVPANLASSNPNVVMVTPSSGPTPLTGVVTAVGAGTATLTATVGANIATMAMTVPNPPVTLTPAVSTLRSFGEPVIFTASSAPGQTIAVSSSNPNVVTVTPQSGLSPFTFTATAVDNGTAVVTASSGSISATAVVTVAQEAASVSVGDVPVLTSLGGTATLTAAAVDARGNAVSSITWSTSNPNIINVSPGGSVTAVSNGVATVTATAGANNLTGTSTVTVSQVACVVNGNPPVLSLALGGNQTLTALAFDCNGFPIAGLNFNWASSDTSKVTLSSATGPSTIVAGVGLGTATVTATEPTSGRQGSVSVSVSNTVSRLRERDGSTEQPTGLPVLSVGIGHRRRW